MKSMTGFGRVTGTLPDGTEATVLVRGVNHRFLDLSIKVRDDMAAAEPEIRRTVGKLVQRGHVDVIVRTVRPVGRGASFDEEAAVRYVSLWRAAATNQGLPTELSARDLISLPGVLRAEESAEVTEEAQASLVGLVRRALEDFDATRRREGLALRAALEGIVERLEGNVARLQSERAGLSERVARTLTERLQKLLADVPLEPQRVVQEAAILADRADISEEVDRLRAHLTEVRRLLHAEGPVGKRLDFLAQELHREVNTSGSKVREMTASRVALDLKSDVEAFKEQVQNIE